MWEIAKTDLLPHLSRLLVVSSSVTGGCSFLFKDLRGLSICIPALNFSTPALKSDHRSVEV